MVFWTATGLIGLDTLLFTMVAPALPVFAEREGFAAGEEPIHHQSGTGRLEIRRQQGTLGGDDGAPERDQYARKQGP